MPRPRLSRAARELLAAQRRDALLRASALWLRLTPTSSPQARHAVRLQLPRLFTAADALEHDDAPASTWLGLYLTKLDDLNAEAARALFPLPGTPARPLTPDQRQGFATTLARAWPRV